jgi:YgiT-type zinc finger domain-containing protein
MIMEALTKCPMCGSRKISRVCEAVEVHPRGRAVRVDGVCYDHCRNCGERFFDSEASAKIDAAVASSRIHAGRRSA